MFAKASNSTPAVPSRNALRVLRQLAFAGSTVGGFCTLGVVTYDVHRRVRIAEQIIENKRTLRTSAPNYDATASAKRLAVMMEAAEAGEFMGLDSLKNKQSSQRTEGDTQTQGSPDPHEDSSKHPHELNQSPGVNNYGPFNQSRIKDIREKAAARVALAREAEQLHEARDEADMPIEKEISELILQDQEIEAAHLFLRKVLPVKDDTIIAPEIRDIARQLFAMNCMKGNIFLARSLFKRMANLDAIDVNMWGTMMHLLAKEGHIDSVGVIYEKFYRDFAVPHHLLEVVLRSLLESRRVNAAKKLFYSRIQDDENGGLCGAFLDGLWRKTRSIDLIIAESRNIILSLSDHNRSPTEKVFNPLVKAFIESGQHEDAEALVADMPTKHNVQPGSRTLGLLLYARALTCDWEGVLSGLSEMHRLGFTRKKRSFAYAFDRVFLEYYPTHSGQEIFEFLTTCIQRFGLVPDAVLHRHILEALIEKGDSSLITQVTRMAQELQWNTGVDQGQFVRILNARRLSMQDSPVGFWRMLQAAKKQYGQIATSRRLLGTGAPSYALDREVLRPIHHPAEETFPKSLDKIVHGKPIDNFVSLRSQMEAHINGARYKEAFVAYRTARDAGLLMKPTHVHLAVIATILAHGCRGLLDAQTLIKSEFPNWLKTPKISYNSPFPLVPPIFFQQVLQLDKGRISESTLLKMTIFEYYNLCRDTPHLTVKHHAVASLCKQLFVRKSNQLVIDVLTAVYRSTWRKTLGFDQVLFKMLMRAFAFKRNIRGVWWCMMAVLARQEPTSRDFFVESRRLLSWLEVVCKYQAEGDQITMSHNISVLNRLANALEASQQADSEWVSIGPLPEEKAKKRRKAISRSAQTQDNLPKGSVKAMISGFDEEMELDLLMNGGSPPAEHELENIWAEEFVLTATHLLPERRPRSPASMPLNLREKK